MRFDAIGLFWDDKPHKTSNQRQQRPMPEIPNTGWKAPTYFPDLSSAVCLSLDTETYDPELEDNGPGWARGVGHIIGVSVGAVDRNGQRGKWYYPIRHETMPEDNCDPEQVFAWLRDVMANPNQPKIGANLQYDIGWLRQEGVDVAGELVDVQFAEALLNEAAPVALEDLSQKYLGEGKESNLMYQWLSDWFGCKPNGTARKFMYKTPPCLAGPYAESDADLPLRLAAVFYGLLTREGLLDLFRMENKLIRLMVDMRFEGVTVDLPKAERMSAELGKRFDDTIAKIKHITGYEINVDSANDLAKVFDYLGLSYGKTKKGAPSFTKAFLGSVNHPVAELIREARKLAKLKGTFIDSYILTSHVNSKLYCSFHQLRGEGNGTRSGRFSSSLPNLQNIPSRDDELAPLIRGMFIPDPGHPYWRKYDYSQIEYRMLIHYAIGPAGDIIRNYFNAHPETDYHVYAQEVVQQATGILIERKPIKNINFGLIYGMGVAKLAIDLKMDLKSAKKLMEAYFVGVPFAKPTMDACMKEAQELGIITTVLGRRSRFDLWEPSGFGTEGIALPYNQALGKYGRSIQRAYTHKALNRRLQGSAADLMKVAMLKCYEDGVFAETGVPRLTVHDELDFSDPGGRDAAFLEMKHILETALPGLRVPVKADGDIGPDWGHVEAIAA